MSEQAQKTSNSETRICPTCGTKVAEEANRCLVCGTGLAKGRDSSTRKSPMRVSLSFPLALLVIAIFTLLSAGLTFAAMRFTPIGEQPTPTETPSPTATQTLTPEPTATDTPIPTSTPLPPVEYVVVENDTCAGLAFFYSVSVRSIIELNNLGVDCVLTVGQTILIPQPTPTATPQPTATLSPAEATEAACDKVQYTVTANDTLSAIAEDYQVSMQAIKDYNGMISNTVFEGQLLIIPLCARLSFGPTPTPTSPPPHPAPNLLLPRDGEAFTLAEDTVTLQWSAVGELRENEFYEVTVQDITDETGRQQIIEYVTDTKFIVPTSFRPAESTPHIMRWWVRTVRQIQAAASGDPRYESAGGVSVRRAFTWSGAAISPSPTP